MLVARYRYKPTLYSNAATATNEKAPAAMKDIFVGFVPKFRSVAAIVPM